MPFSRDFPRHFWWAIPSYQSTGGFTPFIKSEEFVSSTYDEAMAAKRTISWCGFSVQVPLPKASGREVNREEAGELNITRYQGDEALGLLVLADLERERLEIKWRKMAGKRGRKELGKILDKLRARGMMVEPLMGEAAHAGSEAEGQGWWITPPAARKRAEWLLLVRGARRLYEWTGTERAVLEHLWQNGHGWVDHSAQPYWPWEVYGIKGMVPAAMKRLKVSLLPGRSQIEFGWRGWARLQREHRGGRLILGSWSLADRLLGKMSLRAWAQATIPLVQRYGRTGGTGRWMEDNPQDGMTEELRIAPTKWGKLGSPQNSRRGILLRLAHVRELNLIRWMQLEGQWEWMDQVCAAQGLLPGAGGG